VVVLYTDHQGGLWKKKEIPWDTAKLKARVWQGFHYRDLTFLKLEDGTTLKFHSMLTPEDEIFDTTLVHLGYEKGWCKYAEIRIRR